MCTAIYLDGYVGRNLDIERSHGEALIITPRMYTLPFRKIDNTKVIKSFKKEIIVLNKPFTNPITANKTKIAI